MQQERAKL